jgi:lipopolysaccharide transport system ATP-binding protein
MDKSIAIKVENVSKTFKIPHEKVSSVRGAVVSAFRKKSYEEFNALDDISFEVKKGEFFGIIGRNGSGKSTLLKILAGIYQTDKGKVQINGRISPFLELGIGFNPELSGRDNVYLNATVLGLSKKEIDKKFDSIVAFSELERFIDQKLKNYSSGMQVRLAFSVSIHANREILLMDEVLAVGDSNFQSKCLSEFAKYRDMGKTVILVTHDIVVVQRYCDRALLLSRGRIIKIGKADEVGNEYVRQNMNDEEKRINDKKNINKITLSTESGEFNSEKIAEITKVEFLDEKECKKNIFETGDDIIVRIFYRTKEIIKKPVFGIAVYTQDGIALSGPNTRTSDFVIEDIFGNGKIDFLIKNNMFFSGKYYFTAGIYDWSCQIPFDIKVKKYTFQIFSKESGQYGLININHLWIKK